MALILFGLICFVWIQILVDIFDIWRFPWSKHLFGLDHVLISIFLAFMTAQWGGLLDAWLCGIYIGFIMARTTLVLLVKKETV